MINYNGVTELEVLIDGVDRLRRNKEACSDGLIQFKCKNCHFAYTQNNPGADEAKENVLK